MKHVLMLKAGEAATEVRLTAGDYDHWFIRTLGLERLAFDIVHVWKGQKLPDDPGSYDAVMMTGSPLSVTAPVPWMDRAADYLLKAAQQKVPVLGVCFGHQLLGRALGASVIKNPNGREIGTIEVQLTPEGARDPLFQGFPPRFAVQATHEDVVSALPPGARALAQNENTPLQAMAYGQYIRTVQFHPEAQPDTMTSLIHARAEGLEAEAADRGWVRGERVRQLLAGVRPSPFGRQILVNFLRQFA
jgi:GMP synthase (glutamine-hydrolysing)